ncbi:hypothetical protein BB934_36400 (plasmid) [Microvirga ossetica]|uniref:Uncharacterized protein n=1 Tax=Microvirga ossetica TaxID=1882682 RepID=A0A1B2EUT7_9HYPH|nr:hypothetical protein [Microvirga ossetica]ANY83724.1 hypothetical protein BB934_36400 [Microvirga ossetica]
MSWQGRTAHRADSAKGRSSRELKTSEFLPDELRCLGANAFKPFKPVGDCHELVERIDAVFPQSLPRVTGQTQPLDRAADTFQ